MKNCIVLIGPPCSGKSTIGTLLANKLEYSYVSSGDIARAMAKEDGTEKQLAAGNMAPEDKMRKIIGNHLKSNRDIVLDGFPRFNDQLDWMMNRFMDRRFVFLFVDVPTLTLFNRADSRNRDDDHVLGNRLDYYKKNTVPMINRIKDSDAFNMIYVVNDHIPSVTVMNIERCLYGRGWV